MKFKSLVIVFVLAIFILMVPTLVQAVPTVQTIKVNNMVVNSATNISAGDVLKIKIKTDEQNLETASLAINFGIGNMINLTGESSTTESGVIDFEYTLTGKEDGRLNASTLVIQKETTDEEKYSNFIISANDITAKSTDEQGSSNKNENSEEQNGTNAEELKWTDFSNAKYNATNEVSNHYFSISNVTWNKEHSYSGFFTEKNVKPTLEFDESGFGYVENGDFIASSAVVNGLNKGVDICKYFEKNVDTLYLWIVETQKDSSTGKQANEFVVSGQKIDRPKQLQVGSRINAYFFSYASSVFIRELYETERNVNIKIGKIADNTILKSIKNGESGCLNKLMTYAKSADAIYTCTLSINENGTITDKFEIIDKAYYYVYMELEDENGKYYPIEDVSLYQGCVSEAVGKALFDYLSSDFKWNLQDDVINTTQDEPKDQTTAKVTLPQTGKNAIIGVILISLIVVGIIIFKKYNTYKDI